MPNPASATLLFGFCALCLFMAGLLVAGVVRAGGDPVEILLTAKSQKRTELRIRIGVLGDETRSRLVLEEIHRSLASEALTEQEQSQAESRP